MGTPNRIFFRCKSSSVSRSSRSSQSSSSIVFLPSRFVLRLRIVFVVAYLSLMVCVHVVDANSGSGSGTLTRVVHTRYGKIQGIVKSSSGSNKHLKPVEMFLGVPYATPPTGANRFSPTRALTPWEGIKLFNTYGPVCPQWLPDVSNETAALERMPRGRLEHLKRLLPYLKNQSEDCLYLNIFAPAQGNREEPEQKYPVVVYIHGESYSWNSGNPFDGRVLASYSDLIIITLNYRLGVLGFLNTNSEPYQNARVANYGLMDQIAALHWIQQNIGHFGGDSKNITLMGHGTGAACINFLMISPAVTQGLFHRAILLSGSALSSWAIVEEPVIYSLQIARQMNCTSSDKESFQNHERITDCLREVPIAELMKAKIVAPTFLNAFGPSVDGVVIKTNYQEEILTNILPELQAYNKAGAGGGAASSGGAGSSQHTNSKPRDSKSLITANKYDLLFGCVTSEALWRFSHNDIQSGFEGDRRDRILRTYVRNTYNYHLSEIFFTIVNEYTDWERTVLHPINTRDSTIAALSDAQFVAPLVQTGDLFSRSSSGHSSGGGSATNQINSLSRLTKSFFYVFDYQTKDGDYPQRMGTVHGEELPYVFGAPLAESLTHFPRNFTKSEVTLSEAFMIYVGNFARTGNPNEYQKQEPALVGNKERNRFRGTLWEEYDPIHQKYLEIGIKPKVKNHFRAHQLSVWLRLIPELHRAGMEDVSLRHNMFRNHEGDLYDGVVKTDRHNNLNINTRRPSLTNGTVAQVIQSITTEPFLTTCVNVPSLITTSDIVTYNATDVSSTGEPQGLVTYSATLGLTIAIGCTLLVLNVLIFAGVYYQRDKTRMEIKNLQEQQLQHQQQLSSNSSSPYGSKTIPRGYQPGSIMLEIEPDTASMILNSGATLPKSSQHGFKYPTNLATLPRHYQSKSHIIKNGDHICEGKSLHTFSENCVSSPPNGSIIMPPSALPKPPPPPKSSPPPESQPLLHTGAHHLSNSLQPHQKGGILKVPAAAISEMRV